MALPKADVEKVRWFCNDRVPEHIRDQVWLEIDATATHVTIIECRPPWRPDHGVEPSRFPIARLRYTGTTKRWSLYWRDRNLKFHQYNNHAPSAHIEDLLAEIARDPTGIFWG